MWRHLAHPEWFEAALGVALLAAAALLAAHAVAGRRRLRLVGSGVAPRPSQRISDFALLLALVAILVALLGPRVGERVVRLPGTGVDVAILIDVSRSMDARDVPPSRLDRARRLAGEVLERLDARDRVALAAFGGRGVLLTPLTPDRAALAELLAAVDTDLVHPAGSDLGGGVAAAALAFSEGSERPRVLLVLADGEDPEGRSDLATGALRRMEVRVIAAAIGTEAGSTIPDRGAELRDRRGEVVVTRRRASRLERITTASGGAMFLADARGRVDADALLAALRRDAGSVSGEPALRRVAAVRVLPLAALAFALLLVEGLPRVRVGRRPGRLAARVALPLVLVAASSGPDARPGQPAAPDARSLVWLGLDRLERGERDAAARAFEAAAITARDPAVAAVAYHDLAVTALERGDLEAARDAFFDALALEPGDSRTRFNLEWTLRALAAAPPPAEDPEPTRDPPPPSPDGDADPPPAREPEPESPAQNEAAPTDTPSRRIQTPDASLRERWLERVEDDLSRAVQSAVRDGPRPRGAGPAW